MFTGIIKKTARVKAIEEVSGGITVQVVALGLRAKKGDSISVDGVCSTVVKIGRTLEFQYMPETLSRSTLAVLRLEDLVNLEPSLKVSDRLDGHIVMGHVDTTGKILSIVDEGNSKVLTITVREPKRFIRLVAEKGSVAVDGVSLTVASVSAISFTVKIVPYTWEYTGFKNKKVGSQVNLEFDIIAKYLHQLQCK